MKKISDSNHSLFGTMTMYYTLRNEGYGCGHNRVYRLMCIHDIKSSYRLDPDITISDPFRNRPQKTF
ncbi:transposase [Faecalicoccus pleomorphus]|uniref:IS3 family transposase n=1 Tax=Faecalicoccus pleomorphus TaxID=1323 RepID=UPI00196068D6|nr:transposase [Faecalicoccus pleomorphus]